MDIFQEVKDTVSMPEVAAGYGMKGNRAGFIRCPFHNDRTPSLKLYDDHFHCFGCGAHGDVIRFTELYFNLSPLEAAKKLIEDYHLTVTTDICRSGRSRDRPAPAIRKRQDAYRERKEFDLWRTQRIQTLLDEYNRLKHNKERFAPRSPDEEWHPLFCEALQHLSKVEWELDLFLFESKDELKTFWKQERKEQQHGNKNKEHQNSCDAICA